MAGVLKKFAFSFALFALGAAGGFLFSGVSAPDAGTATGPETKPVKKVSADDSAEVKALRRKVRDLEARLARREETAEPIAPPAPAPHPPAPKPESVSERMARLEREDPGRYGEITNRIAQWRRTRARRTQEKMEFLSSLDVSGMSADARKTHARLQELTVARHALEERMHSRDLTDAERGELFREMREYDRELHELNAKERDNLLEETVRNLGFDGDDVREISATVKEVFEATDSPRRSGRRPR